MEKHYAEHLQIVKLMDLLSIHAVTLNNVPVLSSPIESCLRYEVRTLHYTHTFVVESTKHDHNLLE